MNTTFNFSVAAMLAAILSSTLIGSLDRVMPVTPLASQMFPSGAEVVLEDVIFLLENHKSEELSKYFNEAHYKNQKKMGVGEKQYRAELIGLDQYMKNNSFDGIETGAGYALDDISYITVLCWDRIDDKSIEVTLSVVMRGLSSLNAHIVLEKSGKKWILTGPVG